MKLDLFTEVQCPPAAVPARRLEELLEQAELADALGFDGLWLAEIHFQQTFSLLAAPYVVLGAIAARTRRLRLGVAVNILPVHHPLAVAEQVATLDVLSHGRAQFAMGRGHLHSRVYEGFGVSRAGSREAMEEGLALVRAAWTQDVVEFHGRFYDVPEVAVCPKPLQQPHPPVFTATSSLDGVQSAARQGLDLFLPVHFASRQQLCDWAAAYWDGLRRHGHDPRQRQLGLNLPVHVAPTTAQAREQARAGFMDYYRVVLDLRQDYQAWAARHGRAASEMTTRDEMTFERLCAESAVIADPPTAVAALRQLAAQTGASRILCWMNMGSIPHEAVLASMRLFAEEVAPRLAAASRGF